MKRTCRQLVGLVCLAFLAVPTGKTIAEPVSMTLTLDPLQSSVDIIVDALGGITASTATTLSGTQGVTFFYNYPALDFVMFDGGDFGMSDTSMTLSLGPLGNVRAGFVGAGLSGLQQAFGVVLNYTGGDYSYTFDPSGLMSSPTIMEINSGLLTYSGSGSIGLLLGSGTLDFASSPAGFELPPLGQVASLTQTLLPPTTHPTSYAIVLSMPISVAADVLTDPLPVAGTIVGQIVMAGILIPVPEPTAIVLVGLAALGLVPIGRRSRGRRLHRR